MMRTSTLALDGITKIISDIKPHGEEAFPSGQVIPLRGECWPLFLTTINQGTGLGEPLEQQFQCSFSKIKQTSECIHMVMGWLGCWEMGYN